MKALNDFGISLAWKFKKVSSSFLVEPSVGTIYCDLGGKLTAGIIDPHGRGHQSATAAVAAMPHLVLNHLLGPLNQAFNSGQKIHCEQLEFTFAVSRNHWDGLCCFVLCDHLVRTGKMPTWSQALVESANLVDHGKVVLAENQSTAPLLLFYALISKFNENVRDVIINGSQLIKLVGSYQTDGIENPFLNPIPNQPEFLEFLELGKYNDEDLKIFKTDLDSADIFKVSLPSSDEDSVSFEEKEIDCLMFLEPPSSRLFVHWSRFNDDYDLLVVPSANTAEPSTINRWTISVNPKSRLNLRRLGYMLEQEERKIREEDTRGGRPRWNDSEYSDNSDPWYDGRDHDFTLVDSPRSGTLLRDPNFIKRILQSRFYGVSLKPREENQTAQTRLLSYLFFEFNPKMTNFLDSCHQTNPFRNLSGAYSYIQEMEFFEPSKEELEAISPSTGKYKLSLYFSKVTEHAVLEIETSLNTEENILEDMEQSMKNCGEAAIKIGQSVAQKFSLESKVWGGMNFSLLIFIDPDLNFHDEERLSKLFGKLTKNPVTSDDILSLKNQPKGDDLISSSASVCVLRQSSKDKLDENRRLIALYSLFVKTAYRRFSQRLEPLTRTEDIVDAQDEILNIQTSFSRFLAAYDFSGTEISMDGEVTQFFHSMSACLALEEQKKETNIEIQLIGNLASSLENRERVKQNKRLNISIFVLSLLAVCDFLYALSSDIHSDYLDALPKFGLTFSFVVLIGSITSLFLFRRAKKQK